LQKVSAFSDSQSIGRLDHGGADQPKKRKGVQPGPARTLGCLVLGRGLAVSPAAARANAAYPHGLDLARR
jgi:hypothetical protein